MSGEGKRKIIWDNEAKKSLRSIYNYVKSQTSIERAKKVRNEIVASTRSLNDFPDKFEKVPALRSEIENYRYKVIWTYKIIYEVSEEAIFVVDIFHTSRDPSNIKTH